MAHEAIELEDAKIHNEIAFHRGVELSPRPIPIGNLSKAQETPAIWCLGPAFSRLSAQNGHSLRRPPRSALGRL